MTKKRVLVLEDQMLIAFELKAMLTEIGAEVIGPCADVESALEAIEMGIVDLALLDINLSGGVTSIPVADALQEKNKPFVFVTAYGSGMVMPERFGHVTQYSKPVRTEDILRFVKEHSAA